MLRLLLLAVLILLVFEAGYTLGWEARSLQQHGRRLDLATVGRRRMIGLWKDIRSRG